MDTTTLYIIANSVALFNNVLIIFFLVFRKNNTLPNYLLALIFFTIGSNFLFKILSLTGKLELVPAAFFISQNLINFFSILVYYYIHLIITDKKKHHSVLIIGSLICIVSFLGITGYYYSLPTTEQPAYLALIFSDECPDYIVAYNIVFFLSTIAYLIVLYKEVQTYQKSIERNFSSLEGVQITYIQNFLKLLILLNISIVPFLFLFPLTLVDFFILPVVGTIFYIFIIRQSIVHNAIFTTQTYRKLITKNAEIIPNLEIVSESMSVKNEEKEKQIISKLETALLQDKLFKNPVLKLTDLADAIEEPPYLTSQVLNFHFNKTFFEIINELRVKEAEILLKSFDSKTDKIEAIGYDAGFNSRASFYRSFKKYTGKMPKRLVSTH